jgi:spermidine synthase
MVLLFTATSFLTASLLFLVQPMVGRMVLPAFGGSPQVWTTSMLFFQVALLVGYGYTHLTTTRLPRRAQPWVHLGIALLPLAVLPIALTVAPSGGGGLTPSFELLAGLTLGVAAPFVLIATSGPLIQRWFSWTAHPHAQDPYFLYAAGNVGSAAGLLAYPLLLEPTLTIAGQSRLWAVGYGVALILIAGCALAINRSRGPAVGRGARDVDDRSASHPRGQEPAAETEASIGRRRAGRWIVLAFIPSSLMLAVTSLMSTDIAAVPLLWIVPLGVYLLTFTVAFSAWGPTALRWGIVIAPVVILAAVSVRPVGAPVLVALAVQVLLVAVGGIVSHGLLAADRPPPLHLTRFYLLVAIGGAFGGLFNGMVAPALFPTLLEYGVTVALLVALVVRWREPLTGAASWTPALRLPVMLLVLFVPLVWFLLFATGITGLEGPQRALVAVLVVLPLLTPLRASGALGAGLALIALAPQLVPLATSDHVERTFFGVHRVVTEGDTRHLIHGTTIHGSQVLTTRQTRSRANNYYHAEEPFGDVVRLIKSGAAVGAVGLGAGEIAVYGRPGQQWVFHEIDPAVVEIAREQFTYLDDSLADIEVVIGDGRLTLQGSEWRFDAMVVDAFTSDAIPVHLLTVEAFASYLDVLERDAFFAVNISNRYLDLVPVLAAAAAELQLEGVVASGDGTPETASPSQWVVLASDPGTLLPLRELGWEALPDEGVLWTDQRSSLFRVFVR